MSHQRSLFGRVRLAGKAPSDENRILFPAELEGIDQPFKMAIVQNADLEAVLCSDRVSEVDRRIVQASDLRRPVVFSSGWYRFMRIIEGVVGDLHIRGSLGRSPRRYRLPALDEGLALISTFPNFPSTQPIWILDAKFVDPHSMLRVSLVMHHVVSGWRLDLDAAAAGSIRPDHLVLVHCNLR